MRAYYKNVWRGWQSVDDFRTCAWDAGIAVAGNQPSLCLAHSGNLADDDGQVQWDARDVFTDTIWVRKMFAIDNPRALRATLMVQVWSERVDRMFMVEVNGTSLCQHWHAQGSAEDPAWTRVAIPVKWLVSGTNEIVLKGLDAAPWQIALTTCSRPNRSAKSLDAGAHWDCDYLGAGNVLSGAYAMRLELDGYVSEGVVTSGIVDLGHLASGGAVVRNIQPDYPRSYITAREPDGTTVRVEWRAGAAPVPDEAWSDWLPTSSERPAQRYFQWRARLRTSAPDKTPQLESVGFWLPIEEQA